MWPAAAVANEGLAHPLFVLEEKPRQPALPSQPRSCRRNVRPFIMGFTGTFGNFPGSLRAVSDEALS